MSPFKGFLLLTLLLIVGANIRAQDCDETVPEFDVDLTADPNGAFVSPWVQRLGNCCGTIAPAQCVSFVITLHPNAEGIIFDVCDGAISSGSMFYQVGCGPETEVGQSLCLDGQGPHYLTFCKPGNNENIYCITSVSEPTISPDQTLNEGCSGQIDVAGFDPESIVWQSVSPGIPGEYNNFLSCTDCFSASVNAVGDFPEYVDFEVCGLPLGGCDLQWQCVTSRVYFNPALEVSIVPAEPVICYGLSTYTVEAVVSGGTQDYTIEWDNGDTDHFADLGPGIHTVTLSDALDCPGASFTFEIIQLNEPATADAGADVQTCSTMESIPLAGTVSGAPGGSWSGGQGTFQEGVSSLIASYLPSPAEMVQGSVELTLTTDQVADCPVASDAIAIEFGHIDPEIAVTTEDVSCFGLDNGLASLYLPSGYTYTTSWGDGSETIQGDFAPGSYTVFIEDQIGCDTTLTFSIAQPTELVIVDAVTEDPACHGDNDGSIEVTVEGGIEPCAFIWEDLDNSFPENNNIQNDLAAGTYNVTITDANGCSTSWSGELTEANPVEFDVEYDPLVCPGEPVVISVNAIGGEGVYNYLWSNGQSSESQQEITVDNSIVLTVAVQDENFCTSALETIEIDAVNFNNAVLDLSGGVAVCPGEYIQLTSSFTGEYSPYAYTWSHGLGTELGEVDFQPTTSDYVHFTVSDVCQNELQDSIFVQVFDVPVIQLPYSIAQGCVPLEVDFDAQVDETMGGSFYWEFGDGYFALDEEPYFVYQTPGTYDVSLQYTSPEGCVVESENTGLVVVNPLPWVEIIGSADVVYHDDPVVEFSADASVDVDYQWDFGDGFYFGGATSTQTFEETGPHTVELTVYNQYGCTFSDDFLVIVLPEHDIVVPNTFTPDPNNQGGYYDPTSFDNNVFFPFIEDVVDFEMRIFNRWGELVFESFDANYGWDGYYNGQLSQQDVYVYRISASFEDGKVVTKFGDVSLIR